KLDEIINTKNGPEIDRKYWGLIFENCIKPFVKTLRDVSRIVNVFQFRYGILWEEICVEEIIALSVLDVLEPNLYKWISMNKDSVCESRIHALMSNNNIRDKYILEFKELGIDSKIALKAISTIFPVFAKDVGEYVYIDYSEKEKKQGQMRLLQSERFNTFFLFDLKQVKVPRRIILDFINNYNMEEIDETLISLNDEIKMPFFLRELRTLLSESNYDRIELLISSLYRNKLKLVGKNNMIVFSFSSSEMAEYCIIDLLKLLKTDKERELIIKEQICSGDLNLLASVSMTMATINNDYIDSNENTNNKKIDLSQEQYETLKSEYVKAINMYIKNDSIINNKEFHTMFYLWKIFDKRNADEFMKNCLKNKENCLRFICRRSGIWTGTNGYGWSYNIIKDENYISYEELYDIVISYDKQKLLKNFTELEQIQLASFVLNYKRIEMEHANIDEAKELIVKWKNGTDD
nr:hypothetical protein [Lachnospiraceae bacterium]